MVACTVKDGVVLSWHFPVILQNRRLKCQNMHCETQYQASATLRTGDITQRIDTRVEGTIA
jgi:hypothetical protein